MGEGRRVEVAAALKMTRRGRMRWRGGGRMAMRRGGWSRLRWQTRVQGGRRGEQQARLLSPRIPLPLVAPLDPHPAI